MIEKNDLFDYGYYIYQNKDYFKFSLDSILLAEFVTFKESDQILDMCTGNAPIPLILTSKNKKLQIDAVEIQKEIYQLANKSLKINNTKNIKLYNNDVKTMNFAKVYDIIICNPPYFKVTEQSHINENQIKRFARHEICINLEEIIECAYNNLNAKGNFYMVHRTDRLLETIELMVAKGFGIRKICFVFTKQKSNAEFFLLEASKYKKSDPKITYLYTGDLKSYKNIFNGGD